MLGALTRCENVVEKFLKCSCLWGNGPLGFSESMSVSQQEQHLLLVLISVIVLLLQPSSPTKTVTITVPTMPSCMPCPSFGRLSFFLTFTSIVASGQEGQDH